MRFFSRSEREVHTGCPEFDSNRTDLIREENPKLTKIAVDHPGDLILNDTIGGCIEVSFFEPEAFAEAVRKTLAARNEDGGKRN